MAEIPKDTRALEECDLVMKGGVTSGIVYPATIIKLAEKYRFRSIGGTSAGAIAASLTAAAEYGRQTGGFERLRAISLRLGEGTFLRDLFQPSREVKPLFDLALSAMEVGQSEEKRTIGQNIKLARRIVRSSFTSAFQAGTQKGILVGALAGLVLALIVQGIPALVTIILGNTVSWSALLWPFLILLVLFSVLGGWLGSFVRAGAGLMDILTRRIPGNFFGMCTGLHDPADTSKSVLTVWLTRSLNDLAGIKPGEPPLTFGALSKKGIELKMISSNLSQSRPYELPFENKKFIYRKDDFNKLFTKDILEHMEQHAYESKRVVLPDGYRFLPLTEELPVAVAMRMSLSFPLLLSAIPLYTIKESSFRKRQKNNDFAVTPEDMQVNWFSDGGIASNFPIHFFDSWVPERPTFGIKLTSMPPDAFEDAPMDDTLADVKGPVLKQDYVTTLSDVKDDGVIKSFPGLYEKAVFLPEANMQVNPEWEPLEDMDGKPSITKFMSSIFGTAQNYRDNTLSALPSYRERIVHIRLNENEGGLNLAMDRETILKVMEKGHQAGETILADFNFRDHQWVRLRLLFGLLENKLVEMARKLAPDRANVISLMQEQIEATKTMDRFPYPRSEAWCEDALERLMTLDKLLRDWEEEHFHTKLPKPTPHLRVEPDL